MQEVWGDRSARLARTALHTYVASLRKTLEPRRGPRQQATVLVRHPAGYSLDPHHVTVDAHRFARLVREAAGDVRAGRHAVAAVRLTEALALWRGTPYADLGRPHHPPHLRDETARLDELRWCARENLAEARLVLGEHEALLPDSEAMTRDQPLREKGWYVRALALYRCCRQGEALAVLRDAQRILRAEIGAEPGPELRGLLTAVLHHDPALDWRPPA